MTIDLMRLMPDKQLVFEPFVVAKRVLVARQVCKLFRDEIVQHTRNLSVVLTKKKKDIETKHMIRVLKLLQHQNGVSLRVNIGNSIHAMPAKITLLLLHPVRLRGLHIDTNMTSAKVHEMIFANCDTLERIEIDTKLVPHRANKEDYKRLANAIKACSRIQEVVLHIEPGLLIGHYDEWLKFAQIIIPELWCVFDTGAWVTVIRIRRHRPSHSGSRRSDTRS